MKRFYLFGILISLAIVGYSHDYKPMVKEGNQWSVLYGGLGSMMKVCCVQTEQLKLLGDTTIELNTYKKVYSSIEASTQNWKLLAFMREDILSKKVWLRDLNNTEGLIYDFDVQVGNQVTLYNYLYPEPVTYQITSIDSVWFQYEYRKRITIKGEWLTEHLIEGVGSEFGVLSVNLREIAGSFRELLCFTPSDNFQYVNPHFKVCYKAGFTPSITNTVLDQAILNQPYNFQITTSEVFKYDTISYYLSCSWLPEGLKLNAQTGLISGIPTKAGTFHPIICVRNNGYTTDYLNADFVVEVDSSNLEATYEPFINKNKRWKYMDEMFTTCISCMGSVYYGVCNVYFKGDTIVDNIKFSKLYKKQEQPRSEKEYLVYLIREDTVDQKVYVFDQYLKKSVLLYDFKLNKGDEFNIYILSNFFSKHTVVKVDTITVANKKLKRIEFDGPITWIEGIGSLTRDYIPSGGELICMRENDDLLYLNPRFNNCDTIFTQGWGNTPLVKSLQVRVFPNPIVSTSVVSVQSNNYEAMKIEIYSYSGALIKEDYFSGDYPIGAVQLAKGMYVYRITLGNKLIQMDKMMVISQ